jgi:hypothetical protein
MGDIAGKVGMLRIGGYTQKNTIAFVDGGGSDDTITDSGNGFLLAGFVAGQSYTISGSADNNYSFTPSAVVAGTITVATGTTTTESAGALVSIKADPPGGTTYGIKDYTISYNAEVVDVSTYDTVQADASAPRDFIGTTTGWTLNAGGYYDTGETAEEDFVGRQRYFYIFPKYVAIPSAPDPAYYYHGIGIITGINPDAPVDSVVTNPVAIQGTGTLSALVTKTSDW